MGWRFVIADSGGRNIGEPDAYTRTFASGVSSIRTAGFEMRDTDRMYESAAAGDNTLKVYDSAGALVLYGPIVADEETAEGQGAKSRFTAADLLWRLGKRYVGKDTAGTGAGSMKETAVDSGTIAYDVLAAVNADEATGITAGTKDTFVVRTVTFTWKKALDAINELGAIEGSYEYVLRYVDGAAGGTPTTYLDLKAALGTDRTTSVFLEYGTGRANCKTYRRARTLDQLATDVYVIGQSSTLTVLASNTTGRARYRRHEDVLTYPDITVTALLDALGAAHAAIRGAPRQLIDLQVLPQLGLRYGVDYVEGDLVTGRVLINGKVRVNGVARVWGTAVSLDNEGNETPTLRLEPS